MRRAIFGGLGVVLMLLVGCQKEAAAPDPKAIVEKAIAVHGGAVLPNAIVSFDFREAHFTITRAGGRYRYERTYTDSTGSTYHEVLDNDGISRQIDSVAVPLSEEEKAKLATPLNSVPYFALLPFNLADPAVQLAYLGTSELEGEPYDKVEVKFKQEGGGRDYQDRFVYWFHRDTHTMDYLAYDFHDGEGGTRFRKAINPRTVGGVRFTDYLNYTSPALPAFGDPIETYDAVMQAENLELISTIMIKNVHVTVPGRVEE